MKRLIFVNILCGSAFILSVFGAQILVSESDFDYTKIQEALNINDVIDIDAYEYPIIPSVFNHEKTLNNFELIQTYPAPFNGTVQNIFDLLPNTKGKEILVTACNYNGQKVSDIYKGKLFNSNKKLTWCPSGSSVVSSIYRVSI